jgi:hypothetical protein
MTFCDSVLRRPRSAHRRAETQPTKRVRALLATSREPLNLAQHGCDQCPGYPCLRADGHVEFSEAVRGRFADPDPAAHRLGLIHVSLV